MKENGLTPSEFDIDGMFTITLRRPFVFNKWVDKWVEKTLNLRNLSTLHYTNRKVGEKLGE
jgi:ATP-dependent DNA helicase RecG